MVIPMYGVLLLLLLLLFHELMCIENNLPPMSMYFSQGPIYVVTLAQTTLYTLQLSTLQLSHFHNMYSNEKMDLNPVL